MRSSTTRRNRSSTPGKEMYVPYPQIRRSAHALILEWTGDIETWRESRAELMPEQFAQYAFVFAAESEASDFYKKVANRSKYAGASGSFNAPSQ